MFSVIIFMLVQAMHIYGSSDVLNAEMTLLPYSNRTCSYQPQLYTGTITLKVLTCVVNVLFQQYWEEKANLEGVKYLYLKQLAIIYDTSQQFNGIMQNFAGFTPYSSEINCIEIPLLSPQYLMEMNQLFFNFSEQPLNSQLATSCKQLYLTVLPFEICYLIDKNSRFSC